MIKKTIIFPQIGFFLFCFISCINTRNFISISYEDGWERPDKLYEPIKNIKQVGYFVEGSKIDEDYRKKISMDYSFSINGSKIKGYSQKQIANSWWIKDTYIFNQGGKLIEQFDDNKNGYSSRELYEYNNKGDLIKKYNYHNQDSIPWKSIYKIDETENKIEEYLYTPEEKLLIIYIEKYNEHGDIIEEVEYNENGYIDGYYSVKCVYLYDKNYNLIEEAEYSSNGEKLSYKTTYSYYKNGNIKELCEYNSDSELRWKYVYKYDKFNNQKKRLEYFSNDSLKDTHTYRYTYDKYNNWIQRIEFIDKKAMYTTSREIEYY